MEDTRSSGSRSRSPPPPPPPPPPARSERTADHAVGVAATLPPQKQHYHQHQHQHHHARLQRHGSMPRSGGGHAPVRHGSWRRERSVSQEFARLVLAAPPSHLPSQQRSTNPRDQTHSQAVVRGAVLRSFQVGIHLEQVLRPTPVMRRKTKVICAIGPSCWSSDMLGELLDAGMNVARLNFSHSDHARHAESLANLRRAVQARPGCHCAVLLDTKGPEIRTGFLAQHTPIRLRAGQFLEITTDYAVEGDTRRVACSYEHLATSVTVGATILIDDGSLVLDITSVDPVLGSVMTLVRNDHLLGEKKNMHLPGAAIQIPGITAKDERDLQLFAIPQAVDIVSGSFVRSAANVRAIRDCLGSRGAHIRVHAKIESIEALRHLDEIIREADGIHVSRGDLGMELAPEQVFLAQKLIIRKANLAGKPVVTSTQMLQSMTRHATPSSAECTDVANAVLDGTDAVMLSAETASGLFPREAVTTMARICAEAETVLDFAELHRATRAATPRPFSMCESVASAAVETAIDVEARLILSFTETGASTRALAKYRPCARILAVTASGSTARQLAGVSRGVSAIRVESMVGIDRLTLKAIAYATEKKWVNHGDRIVLIHGVEDAVSGATNVVKVIEVHGQGFANSPTNFHFKKLRMPHV